MGLSRRVGPGWSSLARVLRPSRTPGVGAGRAVPSTVRASGLPGNCGGPRLPGAFPGVRDGSTCGSGVSRRSGGLTLVGERRRPFLAGR